jgi:Ran GTPase-activating protein 1
VWADAFAEHEGLVDVRMPQNGIRMEGIIELARGLSKNPRIEHLDFQDNAFTIGEDLSGIAAWSKALASWPELHTLNLSDVLLSAGGEVPQLLKTLVEGSNPKLKNLQLQNNNLETESFALLAGAITTTLKNISRLELQWNDAEEDDEHLETLSLSLKQRGGKLIATDEDEEEEEEEEDEEEKEKKELKKEAPVVAEAIREEEKEPTKVADDTSTDDLIAKLSQVKI